MSLSADLARHNPMKYPYNSHLYLSLSSDLATKNPLMMADVSIMEQKRVKYDSYH